MAATGKDTQRVTGLRRAGALALLLAVAGGAIELRAQWQAGRAPDEVAVGYRVEVLDAAAGILGVEMALSGLDGRTLWVGAAPTAVLPEATVARFRLREATGPDGATLEIRREPPHWQLRGAGEAATLRYEVHLGRGGGGSEFAAEALSQLDAGGGRLLGADVFLIPLGSRADSVRVHYALPPGWSLVHPFPDGAASALVPGLGALTGSAVALGTHRRLGRGVGEHQLELALRGHFRLGDPELGDLAQRIARHQIDRYGEPLRQRHVFVVEPHPRSDDPARRHYFGLHFDGSMVVLLDARTDRRRLHAEPAQIIAHEFFHSWLGDLLGQEQYAMNWFVEGVTTWVAYQTRLQLRQLDSGRYARELSARYREEYLANPRRAELSVAAAGEQVLQDGHTTALLYAGGVILAVALDEEIGRRSGHQAGLEELLAGLLEQARLDPAFRLTREALEGELLSLTGSDWSGWLDRHVWGTQPPPLPVWIDAGEGLTAAR